MVLELTTRFLLSEAETPRSLPFDSDVAIILAVPLCTIVCIVSLALVAHCVWLHPAAASFALAPIPAPPNKGLKKKAIRVLPMLSFNSSASSITDSVVLLECIICLAEFADGEVLRVLPQCGHSFHSECVDTWLRSHSCPSCRLNLADPAPQQCPAVRLELRRQGTRRQRFQCVLAVRRKTH
ncbi:hypothetical protein ZIOFF_023925 [Zingiber officinale]|uniref:RING-type domain-containing protein n=1 Tax=Zingiber officinale TaxID=94328 RepID=A0A8J5GSS3_ZINOF|nr:hypothetical protein ZIOFF_023925 [Zingiber officinale]